MDRPLADRIRPKTLDEVVGQRHLLGPNALLRRFIEKGTDANLVFYGPSGTGKTTIANIIATQTHRTLYKLNATTASLQDIKDIMADVGTMMAPKGILLYLDEIQYFNKKQQQSLLEFMENGAITLIARWNDFFWPLLYLRKQAKYTLMVTISLLPVSEGLSTPWPVILAGTTLVIIPIILLYLVLERFQKAGMMEGAVKG